jgi:hypothetical protein
MFRFTIRDMLWLTALVAVLAGWGIDHWQPVTTARVKAMLQRGGFYAQDGGGRIVQYMTKDGITVTVWSFSDDEAIPGGGVNVLAPK